MAKRASKTLAPGNEGQYEHLFANTLDGMLVFDAETMKVVLANQAAAAITGFGSPEEMIEVDIVKGISEGDGDRLAALLADVLRREQSPLVEDVRITTKDRGEVWVSCICKKIDHQGRIAGLVTLREVTDRKRAEERLLASQERNRLLIENANEGIVVIQDEVSFILKTARR
jgi:PAS domain S-box-containing protein